MDLAENVGHDLKQHGNRNHRYKFLVLCVEKDIRNDGSLKKKINGMDDMMNMTRIKNVGKN